MQAFQAEQSAGCIDTQDDQDPINPRFSSTHSNMKIAAAILLAISGLCLAVEQSNLVDRSAEVYQKDNRNLKYVNNIPLSY
ncbi:hypothetical protein E4U45_003962 [Claviceps purpurea]|nr:hypothetical protein E4U45_003962 [Claviceps purpurea]